MAVRPETTNHRIRNLVLVFSPRAQKVFGHASARTGLHDREATAAGSDLVHAGDHVDDHKALPGQLPGTVRAVDRSRLSSRPGTEMAGPGRLRNALQIAVQTPLRDAERH